MKTRYRMLTAGALVGGTVAVLTWLGGGPQGAGTGASGGTAEAAGVRRVFQSAAECRECHQDVWDEWHGSHHQISYLDPEVRALSDDFRNKECQACHLPRPVAVTGYGQRVLPRQTNPEEGVSCLTCHQAADGTILGRHDAATAPCGVRQSRGLVSVDLCASCHNQHGTTDQWRGSRHAQEGRDCNDCHMLEVRRRSPDGAVRPGRSHVYPGAHDAAMLRSAGRFETRTESGRLIATLTNTGAGHNFPTEERHRAVDIEARFLFDDGTAGGWQRLHRFRQPYRDEPGEDTQLPAHGSHAASDAVPEGAVRAEVRLWYRLTPFIGDDDPRSTLLEERTVELR